MAVRGLRMRGKVRSTVNGVFAKWWMSDSEVGSVKRKFYKLLQKRYLFNSWHVEPINFRPYAMEIVLMTERYINQKNIRCVMEVGCGLGDIIGNIKVSKRNCKKIGIDKEHNVINAAKVLHPSVIFLQGSFDNCVSREESCLIMVNFIHRIPYDELKQEMQKVFLKSNVNLVVMDTFSRNENTVYEYSHHGKELFDGKYRCIRRSRGFAAANGARRYIEYWEKIEKRS